MWSKRKLKSIKFLIITLFAFEIWLCCIALSWGVARLDENMWFVIVNAYILFSFLLAIILVLMGSAKSLYATNAFILSVAVATCIESFVFNFERIDDVIYILLLFGLTVIYTLAWLESNDFSNDYVVSPREDTCDDDEFSNDGQRNLDVDLDVVIGYNEESSPEKIEMNDVLDAGIWDNVERQQSIPSISCQNDDNVVDVLVRGTSTHLCVE